MHSGGDKQETGEDRTMSANSNAMLYTNKIFKRKSAIDDQPFKLDEELPANFFAKNQNISSREMDKSLSSSY